ncbi:MAG: SPASM domain-containing protein [Planctomycetes bacterium]|nr:SPASM domain-containing protein [Planctomycetota bacterium]
MHPQFHEACELVRNHGFPLIVTTNGSQLSDSLKEAAIDQLNISLLSLSEEEFLKKNNVQLSYEKYLDSTVSFLKSPPSYETNVYLFGNKSVYHPEYDDYYDLTIPDNQKRIQKFVHKINSEVSLPYPLPETLEINDSVSLVRKRFTNWSHVTIPEHFKLNEAKSIPFCANYLHTINILANGEVLPCCADYDGVLSLGNIHRESLAELLAKKTGVKDLACNEFCRKCKGEVS